MWTSLCSNSKARRVCIGASLAISILARSAGATEAAAVKTTDAPAAAVPNTATVTTPRPKTLFNNGDPTLTLTPPLRGATAAPPGSAPPNPDPRNLEGVWWLQGYEYMLGPEPGVAPPLKPEFVRLLERRIRAKNRGTPEADASTQCLPHGMPRLMESPYPIEIVQTPGRITFLHEVAHNVRRIWMDRAHPAELHPTFMGDSTGRWEGDTLVVDTVGLNDRTFIDDEGSAHSTKLHTVERYRKIEGGAQLELLMTVADPVTLEHSYNYRRVFHWRPDVRPQEYVCEENNRNAPVNGVTVAQ